MPAKYLSIRLGDGDYSLLLAVSERMGLPVSAAARYIVSRILGGEDCVYRHGVSAECPRRGAAVRDGYVCVDGRAYRVYLADW